MRRLLGPAFLLALAIVAIPAPAAADTSDFTFDSFDADYTLSRLDDGTSQLRVVETIVARFPDFDQNRGIIRAIPDDYDGVALNTIVESVVDETGAPVYYETNSSGGFVELILGTDEFVRGPTTYVITYAQQNVVRNFDDTSSNEFYWDVNGTGWGQPFESVSVALHIDPALADTVTGNAACYVGAFGDTVSCPIEQDGTEISAEASDLAPGQTLTIAVGFEQATFVTPEPVIEDTRPRPIPLLGHVFAGGIGVLSLAGVAGLIALRRRNRDATSSRAVVAQYSEPDDITIMQSANLMGRSVAAVPAAIVRLAVRKNLRILAYAVSPGGEPYTLQYLGSAGTNSEDQALLALLFGREPQVGALREFGASQQPLMRALNEFAKSAGSALTVRGFRRARPGVGWGVLIVVGQVLLALVAVATLGYFAVNYFSTSGWLVASMAVGTAAFFACVALAIRGPQLTQAGAEASNHLLGMKLYLTIAEQDRLRVLQSPQGAERINVADNLELIKLYEKLLPWAVMWGVEDQWMKELAVRVDTESYQPDWFAGTNGFNAVLFGSTMRGFSTALTPPVSTSTWTGSGGGSGFSGGSFGGGFSGGGGGGGGGGGR